jgi:hypothetical protein
VNINATLFVQIINFGIAWLFVRNLLVIPAITVHTQQTTVFDELSLRRDLLHKRINTVRDMQYSLWHKWALRSQKSIQGYYQSLKTKPSIALRVPTTPEVPKEDIDKLTRILTDVVVTRLQELP